ncbi:MAG: TIGR02646 family protein [Bacteroidia bacterium]|nr:TIGR02646 family protein [Bacteroidia bacterium]
MKYIEKKTIPPFYSNFIRKNKPQHWSELSREIRIELREYILKEEQASQCAYTEVLLREDNSHIDHFKMRNHFANLTFSYDNLFVAHNDEKWGAKNKDKKIKKEFYDKILSPLSEETKDAFSFSFANGEIFGKTEKAKRTIEVFNLNHSSLKERRMQTILDISNYSGFSEEKIKENLGEFFSLIRFYFNHNS